MVLSVIASKPLFLSCDGGQSRTAIACGTQKYVVLSVVVAKALFLRAVSQRWRLELESDRRRRLKVCGFICKVIREDMAYAKMVLAYIIDGRCDEGELLHFRTIIHK